MIQVRITQPEETTYARTAHFVQEQYAQKLRAMTDARPEAFAYAQRDGRIIGTLGLYEARLRDALMLESYVKDPFGRISRRPAVDRRLCAELGTRVVASEEPGESISVSIALTAALVTFAHAKDVRYVGFTTNRLVRKITDPLGFELINLGVPDLSAKDEAFRRNWAEFFRIPQYCFGFSIESVDGCAAAIRELLQTGITVDV